MLGFGSYHKTCCTHTKVWLCSMRYDHATRGLHLLLSSPLSNLYRPGNPLLIAMRSKRDDKQGLNYELAELVDMALFETGSLTQGRQETADTLWDDPEWD